MADKLDEAIKALEGELQNISMRVVEIKKTINQLLFLKGSGPRYTDIEMETSGLKGSVEKRQFIGKDMLESTKEVMRMRGKKPMSAQEVLKALEQGDLDFPEDWKSKQKLRNMAIYLGSRKENFVWFDTKDGKVYALAEQYPERKRELERQSKSKNEKGITEPLESKQ
jgi:hypothetical protein